MLITENKDLRQKISYVCLFFAAVIAIWEYRVTPLPLKGLTPPTSLQVELAAPDEFLSQAATGQASSAQRARTQVVELAKGKTFEDVLLEAGADKVVVSDASRVLKKIFNPKGFKENQEITLRFDSIKPGEDVRLAEVIFAPSVGQRIVIKAQENGIFKADKVQKPLVKFVRKITTSINTSFLADGLKAGVPNKILHDLIKAFSYDVNFALDIHANDKFTVLFEVLKDEEAGMEGGGDVLYAELQLSDDRIPLFKFTAPTGGSAYYKPSGESIKKEMLSTPVDGGKIGSGYGSRKHPILGFTRMHKGVDFMAPPGTPIVASGRGVVEKMEYNPGWGNYIKIRHNQEYATLYAHMSRFAKGMKRGKTVDQSDVIGFVGQSGLATGPHLHFELYKNGVQINPQMIRKMHSGGKLGGKDYKAFLEYKKKIDALIKG